MCGLDWERPVYWSKPLLTILVGSVWFHSASLSVNHSSPQGGYVRCRSRRGALRLQVVCGLGLDLCWAAYWQRDLGQIP